ncbi:uncharacterized protein TNCV_2828581 [Trichonephila clavipes]|nr:uncharacterized protein TNCV_2828581 [Trichonephila clavipes]
MIISNFQLVIQPTIQSEQRGQSYHTLLESLIRCWDQPLLEDENTKLEEIGFSLKAFQGIKVQHFVLIENYKSLELHGFSDASEKAFGATIYLPCTNSSEQSSMRLLCSKSRIVPIKRVSIPRLELCAAGL